MMLMAGSFDCFGFNRPLSHKVGNTNGDINQHQKETIRNESTRDEGTNRK